MGEVKNFPKQTNVTSVGDTQVTLDDLLMELARKDFEIVMLRKQLKLLADKIPEDGND